MDTLACATASLPPVWRDLLVIEVFISIPYAPNHGNDMRRRVARALYASRFDVGSRQTSPRIAGMFLSVRYDCRSWLKTR